MKRNKVVIHTVVMTPPECVEEAISTAERALLHSDYVYLPLPTPIPVREHREPYIYQSSYPYGTFDYRRSAFGAISDDLNRRNAVTMLEWTQRFAEPEYVRDAIEFNYGKVIYGRRYFMWSDTEYRDDSFYKPDHYPIAIPADSLRPGSWRDPVDSYPVRAYTAHRTSQAAYVEIDLLDYRYADPANRMDDGTPTLKPYRMMSWR